MSNEKLWTPSTTECNLNKFIKSLDKNLIDKIISCIKSPELFLDDKGEKISKSKGNGITIDQWLNYASPESLSLYMYQNPKRAKKLYKEIVPKAVDEYLEFIEKGKRNSFTTTGKRAVITPHKKGTPVHVKASINHNDLLRFYKADKKYRFISDGDKIKWIYLKNNPIGMETIAFKGHEDSPKVIKFIKDYADYEKMYEKALEKKIAMFYESLMWSLPMDKSSTIEKFF